MKQTEAPSGKLTELLRDIAKDLTGTNDQELDALLVPDKRTRASYIPNEYLNDFFQELLDTRGKALATQLVFRNGTLSEAFPWALSKKGHNFWAKVEKETIKNYESIHSDTSSDKQLQKMIRKAESKGFAEGVSTKYGIICSQKDDESEVIDHELLDNGDFYYHNIKVFKNGKWIKPNEEPQGVYADKEQTDSSELPKEISDAIHEFIRTLGR